MIEDPPKLTIHSRGKRPSKDILAVFNNAQTGHVVDAMDGRGAFDSTIQVLAGIPPSKASVTGIALTCWTGPDDNLALIAALDEAEEGDIVVAATDAFRGAAVAGDMVCGMLRNRGVVAFVSDGMVRDSAGILATGLPVFSAGVISNSPARNGPGIVGAPITVGGVSLSTNDIVVCDFDGAVVVPLDQAEQVAGRLEEIRKIEAELELKIKSGLGVPDFYNEMKNSGDIRRL